MPSVPDLLLRHELDHASLDDIRDLLATTTQIEGHAPIGEHKMAHLKVGAEDWDGILAYAERPDGRGLIGYAHLRWNPQDADPRLAVEVVVHPEHRDEGVQAELLDAARLVVAHAGGGRMFLWVHRVEDPHTTYAANHGFDIQRELAYMVRPPVEVPLGPPTPEGITIRRYRGPRDDAAFLEVNNAAFADHPENGGWDAEELQLRRSLDWFDPAGLFMAFRGDEPVAFHWTKQHSHAGGVPHGPLGEVYVLAVHPRAQGMGLGRLMLRVGMRHLAITTDAIVLYVDQANESAVELYRSEGFVTQYLEVCYVDVVPRRRRSARDLQRPA